MLACNSFFFFADVYFFSSFVFICYLSFCFSHFHPEIYSGHNRSCFYSLLLSKTSCDTWKSWRHQRHLRYYLVRSRKSCPGFVCSSVIILGFGHFHVVTETNQDFSVPQLIHCGPLVQLVSRQLSTLSKKQKLSFDSHWKWRKYKFRLTEFIKF